MVARALLGCSGGCYAVAKVFWVVARVFLVVARALLGGC